MNVANLLQMLEYRYIYMNITTCRNKNIAIRTTRLSDRNKFMCHSVSFYQQSCNLLGFLQNWACLQRSRFLDEYSLAHMWQISSVTRACYAILDLF